MKNMKLRIVEDESITAAQHVERNFGDFTTDEWMKKKNCRKFDNCMTNSQALVS